jgi:hypothetical protein
MPTALPQSLGGILKGSGGASTAGPTAAGGVSPTAAAGGKSPVAAKSLLSPPVRSVQRSCVSTVVVNRTLIQCS